MKNARKTTENTRKTTENDENFAISDPVLKKKRWKSGKKQRKNGKKQHKIIEKWRKTGRKDRYIHWLKRCNRLIISWIITTLLENCTKSSLIFIYIKKERKKEKDNVVITGQRMTTTTTPLSLLSGRGKRCCGKGAWDGGMWSGQELRRVCRQNASHLSAKCLASVGKTPRVCPSNAGQ